MTSRIFISDDTYQRLIIKVLQDSRACRNTQLLSDKNNLNLQADPEVGCEFHGGATDADQHAQKIAVSGRRRDFVLTL